MQTLIKQSGDVTIFNLIGKFDGGKDCEKTSRHFKDLIAKGQRKFVINFSLVRWINSNGIGCIIGAKKAVDQAGGQLVLCNLENRDLSTIYKMRLGEILEIKSSLRAALGFLESSPVKAGGEGRPPAQVRPDTR